MTKWTQQMPLLLNVGNIELLTDAEVAQIKKYIEQGTILDVQFVDDADEFMIPVSVIPEVKDETGDVTSNAYVTVIKNGSVVKAEVTEKLSAPVIKGTTPFESTTKVTIESREGTKVYYTTNGDTPDDTATEYEGEITLDATTTIKAIAYKGELYSEVSSKTFTKS